MTNRLLADAIKKALRESSRKAPLNVRLYVDAKPSEAIQRHELPGLGVAAVLPYNNREEIIDVPIKQYKECKPHQKADKAREMIEWLKTEREERDLSIVGFMNALSQEAAARFGLDLIEELPDTRVEKHYGKYRLYFGDETLDFAQAVALVYYLFTVSFAIQQVTRFLKDEDKKNIVALMDRFPGTEKGGFVPGKSAPETDGMKFIKYLKANAETFTGIDETNRKGGTFYRPSTLEGWRRSKKEDWKDPKLHPHFALVDWLVVAAIAHRFRDEFINDFKKPRYAEDAANALDDLYKEFKEFTIFEIANEETLAHIRSSGKKWEVPEKAKQFIYDRAVG